jgi:hypothetical protein
LLLTDLIGLGDELLPALLSRARLVLVLVGLSDVELGFDGILYMGN